MLIPLLERWHTKCVEVGGNLDCMTNGIAKLLLGFNTHYYDRITQIFFLLDIIEFNSRYCEIQTVKRCAHRLYMVRPPCYCT